MLLKPQEGRDYAYPPSIGPDCFKVTDPVEVATWFKSLFANPRARVWVAEVEGVAVGYLLVLRHERPENTFCLARRWHEIDQISVAPASRQQGIGRALIQQALEAAAAEGVSDVEVSSWSFNSVAHAALQRCGFRSRMLRFEATARLR